MNRIPAPTPNFKFNGMKVISRVDNENIIIIWREHYNIMAL